MNKMEEYSEYLHFVKYKQLDLVFSLFFSFVQGNQQYVRQSLDRPKEFCWACFL